MMPWRDRAGRFSSLKALTLAALLGPGVWIAARYVLGNLGARPLNAAIQETGLWTIRLLFLSLMVTPGRQVLRWPRFNLLRRMIGVAAFAYGAAHLTLYGGDQMFDLGTIATEIARRLYLTIGFTAWLGLAALAATSSDGMVRRLGGARWRRLHRLTYGLGALAAVHFFLQTKADITEPLVMAGCLIWLLGYRMLSRFGGGPVGLVRLVGLGCCAGVAVAGAEALYFAGKFGINPARILAADLTWASGVRPAWIVLGLALLTVLAQAGRQQATRGLPGRGRQTVNTCGAKVPGNSPG